MDKESATAAQKKAEAIIPKVGYPLAPNTTSPESLQRYYGRTVIKGDDFFGNLLRTTLTDVSRTWMMLGNRRDRQSWEVSFLRCFPYRKGYPLIRFQMYPQGEPYCFAHYKNTEILTDMM